MEDLSQLDPEEQAQAVAKPSTTHRELLLQLSHELRTPIAVIMGYADIINDESDNATIRDHAIVIRRCGEELINRLDNFLIASEQASVENVPA